MVNSFECYRCGKPGQAHNEKCSCGGRYRYTVRLTAPSRQKDIDRLQAQPTPITEEVEAEMADWWAISLTKKTGLEEMPTKKVGIPGPEGDLLDNEKCLVKLKFMCLNGHEGDV